MKRVLVILMFCVLTLAESPYKPGQEFPQTELESAHLSKLKQQIQKCETQKAYLQLQFSQIEAEEAQAKAGQDKVVGAVNQRAKDQGLDLAYDENVGDSGRFLVKAPEVKK